MAMRVVVATCVLFVMTATLVAQSITEFPIGRGSIGGIAVGADGNVWFTKKGAIGRMTPSGAITEFDVRDPATPGRITVGADGNVWVALTNAVGRLSPAGEYSRFLLPFSGWGESPVTLAADTDDKVWYTSTISRVGNLTTTGVFATYETGYEGTSGITAGPDGNMWFTTSAGIESKICRITPHGVITQFGSYGELSSPTDIVAGPDGNLWFTQPSTFAIGRITPDGSISQFYVGTLVAGIVAGNDGYLWAAAGNAILRVTTDGKVSRTIRLPPDHSATAITRGPDGSLWFIEPSGTLGRLSMSRRRTVEH